MHCVCGEMDIMELYDDDESVCASSARAFHAAIDYAKHQYARAARVNN